MDNDKIVLISLSQQELQDLISSAIKDGLKVKQERELISFRQTCEWLDISASCLNQWKSQGKIPYKKIGGKIFFSRSEIKEALNEAGNYKKLRELR